MDKNFLFGVLHDSIRENSEEEKPKRSKADTVPLLNKAYSALVTKHTFHLGQLVEIKPETRHTKPLYGDVGIVTKIYPEPISEAERSSGSIHFNEQLDMVIAYVDEDGDLLERHVDSRRIQPYVG